MLSRSLLALCAIGSLAAADWTIDTVHSSALFSIQHMGAGHTWGRFEQLAGGIVYDPANEAASTVSVTIQAASVSTANQKRDDHLRSASFFDVVQFPTLTFVSKSWAKTGEGQFDVSGALTIHGVSKAVTIKVVRTGLGKNVMNQKDLVGFEASFDLKRSDYGMKDMIGPVGDDVHVVVALEAEKK